MTFKPGDLVVFCKPKDTVVFWKTHNGGFYLIIEVNLENKMYKVFTLNHIYKDLIGCSYIVLFRDLQYHILLQDGVLNEV